MVNDSFFPALRQYCASLEAEFGLIPVERQAALRLLSTYFAKKVAAGSPPRLTVICTHNSRRSHFGQAWLVAAGRWFGQPLEAYSGGTKATAFHPNAVAALERSGFEFGQLESAANPVYWMKTGPAADPMPMFSKRFDNGANPVADFAAIMVCTDADEACPFVPGADARFSLPFDDPKQADGSLLEAAVYDERCRQVARELFFAVKMAAGEL